MPLSPYSALTVVLAGVEALFQEEQKNILKRLNFSGSILEAKDGWEVLQIFKERVVDLFIISFRLAKINGYDTAKAILKTDPSVKIIIISVYNDPELISSLYHVGVQGFIDKNTGINFIEETIVRILNSDRSMSPVEEQHETINDSCRKIHFTKRERDVIELLSQGLTSKLIAQELALSINTVETYRCRLLEKVNVKNTSELLLYIHKNNALNQ